MIYTGLNRAGEIVDVKAHGGGDVAEVYGIIGELNPVYYKLKTITGTLPLSYKALGKPLSDYLISGNTPQDGTPTPSNPVDVVGCGEMTGNLAYGRINDVNISPNGMIIRIGGYDIAIGRVESGMVYTVNSYVLAFYANEPTISSVSYDNSRIVGTEGEPSTFTAPITGYIAFRLNSGEQAMLNSGPTPLPYEPYGYKLPLTVNGTEYPIYLGNVQTTRWIRKLVLTGDEEFTKDDGVSTHYLYYAKRGILLPLSIGQAPLICNELPVTDTPSQLSIGINTENVFRVVYLNFGADVMNAQSSGNTVEGLKEYLAQQYANGTPVTVWYVLAEPETGIVNEPLMKIGDYADTVSMAQAGVTIPTAAGTNTLTIDTTVQPSEVSITGNIKEVST